MNKKSSFPLKRIITIDTLYSVFEATYGKEYYFDGEQHAYWELVFVLEGKLSVAEDNKIYELTKNQIIFHKPMEFHRLWTHSTEASHIIVMSFDVKDSRIDALGDGVFTLGPVDFDLLMSVFKSAERFFRPVDDGNPCSSYIYMETDDVLCVQSIATKLELLFLNLLKSTTSSAAQINSTSARNYRKIVSVLNENLYDNISVSEIARLTNLSESNLKKTFSMYSGTGIISYFNKMKITKAISLLKDGMSVAETSDALGFSSQNYFSTVFKREMGLSPSSYRKRHEL